MAAVRPVCQSLIYSNSINLLVIFHSISSPKTVGPQGQGKTENPEFFRMSKVCLRSLSSSNTVSITQKFRSFLFFKKTQKNLFLGCFYTKNLDFHGGKRYSKKVNNAVHEVYETPGTTCKNLTFTELS